MTKVLPLPVCIKFYINPLSLVVIFPFVPPPPPTLVSQPPPIFHPIKNVLLFFQVLNIITDDKPVDLEYRSVGAILSMLRQVFFMPEALPNEMLDSQMSLGVTSDIFISEKQNTFVCYFFERVICRKVLMMSFRTLAYFRL